MGSDDKPIALVSNDDGINAPGLAAFVDTLKEHFADSMRIITVAPEWERSGASHAITLRQPLRLQRRGEDRYSLSGTPADCVMFGITELAPRKPSLVFSGINRGYNLAQDTLYSGTVAAALEGSLHGIPAFAFSQAWREEDDQAVYSVTCKVVREILKGFQVDSSSDWLIKDEQGVQWRPTLNVNVPKVNDYKEIQGFKVAALGNRHYDARFVRNRDPRQNDYYWLGAGGDLQNKNDGSDCSYISDNYVTVTALKPELACDRSNRWLTDVAKNMEPFR